MKKEEILKELNKIQNKKKELKEKEKKLAEELIKNESKNKQ